MDLSGALTIGRIRGIAIQVHWSWLLILALLTYSLAQGLFGQELGVSPTVRWVAGAATALAFFTSVMLHELAHSFVAQHYGMRVPSITLFIFGGVSSIAQEMRSAGQEFKVAIAGPLTSWVLAGLLGAAALVTPEGALATVLEYLAFINFVVGAFNLLPGYPLDGGRVFRAIVWARTGSLQRATGIASKVGVGIAYVMILGGMAWVFAWGLGGLWYILIGLFLKNAAEGSYATMVVETALRDVPVSSAMQPAPTAVPAATSVQEVVDTRMLATGERAFLVEEGGVIVGLLTATDISRVPREEWPSAVARRVMVPAERVHTVEPRTRLLEAMQLLQEHDVHQLPVLQQGRVVGILTRADVMRHIELRTAFGSTHGNATGSASP
ncbi:MAG: site-2 protease family protein [Dehalococcoidia bacterium]|nr:site-2 protease family protein [Dehalococcoidia bacterium]